MRRTCLPVWAAFAGFGGPNASYADASLSALAQDAISRVSMNNLAGMMDEVLIALARCKQPTCKVPPCSVQCCNIVQIASAIMTPAGFSA